jgi:hypothetical protein
MTLSLVVGWGNGGTINWGSNGSFCGVSNRRSGITWGSNGSFCGVSNRRSGITWGSNGGFCGVSNRCSGVSRGSSGVDRCGNGTNLLVDSIARLLNDRSLNDLLDRVDLVGLGNSVGLRDINGVWLGYVGLVDNWTFNWDWVWNWDINRVLVDLELWFDASHLGSDSGVGADWSSNPLLFNKTSPF